MDNYFDKKYSTKPVEEYSFLVQNSQSSIANKNQLQEDNSKEDIHFKNFKILTEVNQTNIGKLTTALKLIDNITKKFKINDEELVNTKKVKMIINDSIKASDCLFNKAEFYYTAFNDLKKKHNSVVNNQKRNNSNKEITNKEVSGNVRELTNKIANLELELNQCKEKYMQLVMENVDLKYKLDDKNKNCVMNRNVITNKISNSNSNSNVKSAYNQNTNVNLNNKSGNTGNTGNINNTSNNLNKMLKNNNNNISLSTVKTLYNNKNNKLSSVNQSNQISIKNTPLETQNNNNSEDNKDLNNNNNESTFINQHNNIEKINEHLKSKFKNKLSQYESDVISTKEKLDLLHLVISDLINKSDIENKEIDRLKSTLSLWRKFNISKDKIILHKAYKINDSNHFALVSDQQKKIYQWVDVNLPENYKVLQHINEVSDVLKDVVKYKQSWKELDSQCVGLKNAFIDEVEVREKEYEQMMMMRNYKEFSKQISLYIPSNNENYYNKGANSTDNTEINKLIGNRNMFEKKNKQSNAINTNINKENKFNQAGIDYYNSTEKNHNNNRNAINNADSDVNIENTSNVRYQQNLQPNSYNKNNDYTNSNNTNSQFNHNPYNIDVIENDDIEPDFINDENQHDINNKHQQFFDKNNSYYKSISNSNNNINNTLFTYNSRPNSNQNTELDYNSQNKLNYNSNNINSNNKESNFSKLYNNYKDNKRVRDNFISSDGFDKTVSNLINAKINTSNNKNEYTTSIMNNEGYYNDKYIYNNNDIKSTINDNEFTSTNDLKPNKKLGSKGYLQDHLNSNTNDIDLVNLDELTIEDSNNIIDNLNQLNIITKSLISIQNKKIKDNYNNNNDNPELIKDRKAIHLLNEDFNKALSVLQQNLSIKLIPNNRIESQRKAVKEVNFNSNKIIDNYNNKDNDDFNGEDFDEEEFINVNTELNDINQEIGGKLINKNHPDNFPNSNKLVARTRVCNSYVNNDKSVKNSNNNYIDNNNSSSPSNKISQVAKPKLNPDLNKYINKNTTNTNTNYTSNSHNNMISSFSFISINCNDRLTINAERYRNEALNKNDVKEYKESIGNQDKQNQSRNNNKNTDNEITINNNNNINNNNSNNNIYRRPGSKDSNSRIIRVKKSQLSDIFENLKIPSFDFNETNELEDSNMLNHSRNSKNSKNSFNNSININTNNANNTNNKHDIKHINTNNKKVIGKEDNKTNINTYYSAFNKNLIENKKKDDKEKTLKNNDLNNLNNQNIKNNNENQSNNILDDSNYEIKEIIEKKFTLIKEKCDEKVIQLQKKSINKVNYFKQENKELTKEINQKEDIIKELIDSHNKKVEEDEKQNYLLKEVLEQDKLFENNLLNNIEVMKKEKPEIADILNTLAISPLKDEPNKHNKNKRNKDKDNDNDASADITYLFDSLNSKTKTIHQLIDLVYHLKEQDNKNKIQNTSSTNYLSELKLNNQMQKSEIESLKSKIDYITKQKLEIESDKNNLLELNDNKTQETISLQESISLLRKDLQTQKQMVANFKKEQISLNNQLNQNQEKIEYLENENTKLTKTLIENEENYSKIIETMHYEDQKSKELLSARDSLSKKLVEKNDFMTKLQEKIKLLEEDNTNIKNKNDEFYFENENLKTKVRLLQEKEENLNKKLVEFTQKKEKLIKEKADINNEIEELEKSNMMLSASLSNANRLVEKKNSIIERMLSDNSVILESTSQDKHRNRGEMSAVYENRPVLERTSPLKQLMFINNEDNGDDCVDDKDNINDNKFDDDQIKYCISEGNDDVNYEKYGGEVNININNGKNINNGRFKVSSNNNNNDNINTNPKNTNKQKPIISNFTPTSVKANIHNNDDKNNNNNNKIDYQEDTKKLISDLKQELIEFKQKETNSKELQIKLEEKIIQLSSDLKEKEEEKANLNKNVENLKNLISQLNEKLGHSNSNHSPNMFKNRISYRTENSNNEDFNDECYQIINKDTNRDYSLINDIERIVEENKIDTLDDELSKNNNNSNRLSMRSRLYPQKKMTKNLILEKEKELKEMINNNKLIKNDDINEIDDSNDSNKIISKRNNNDDNKQYINLRDQLDDSSSNLDAVNNNNKFSNAFSNENSNNNSNSNIKKNGNEDNSNFDLRINTINTSNIINSKFQKYHNKDELIEKLQFKIGEKVEEIDILNEEIRKLNEHNENLLSLNESLEESLKTVKEEFEKYRVKEKDYIDIIDNLNKQIIFDKKASSVISTNRREEENEIISNIESKINNNDMNIADLEKKLQKYKSRAENYKQDNQNLLSQCTFLKDEIKRHKIHFEESQMIITKLILVSKPKDKKSYEEAIIKINEMFKLNNKSDIANSYNNTETASSNRDNKKDLNLNTNIGKESAKDGNKEHKEVKRGFLGLFNK